MTRILLATAAPFLATLIIAPYVIPWLKRLKFGQNIRTFGPSTHLRKQGLPTMGGIMIIGVVIVSAAVFSLGDELHIMSAESGVSVGGRLEIMLPALVFTALCALIGFADDMIKIRKKNSAGLRARDKSLLLLIVSAAFAVYCYKCPAIGSQIFLPFADLAIDLGIWFIPFCIFACYATVNCSNITDGVDGLLSGVTMIIAATFALICVFALEMSGMSAAVYGNMGVLSGALTGACLGFLFFNRYPAKVIMGDTGSFGLGGAVCAVAFITKTPLLIPIAGVVYVVSAMSDIVQAVSYKLTGKGALRFAPLHHHFEMGGMKEPRIVLLYCAVTFGACALAVLSVAA